jgi:hypothetical protein
MLKFLKNDGGGRRDHNGRSSGGSLVVEVQPQEEKVPALEEKVQVVDSDLTETPREGGLAVKFSST